MSGFGASIAPLMAYSSFDGEHWTKPALLPAQTLPLHPGGHVLHYASSCFEGLKAYRRAGGGMHLFRPGMHIRRLQNSARQLCLPMPESEPTLAMLEMTVAQQAGLVPEAPGALYLRPLLYGNEITIGSAGKPSATAELIVLAAPVGDYFGGSDKALRVLVDTEHMRATPGFGAVKTGGNYAAALRHIVRARQEHQCDQVLFCPQGDVQETGAANFFLLHEDTLITKNLDGSILPGVTRASLLEVAAALGYRCEERHIEVTELLEKAPHAEAALSGTAAVLAAVGELVYRDRTLTVGDGQAGAMTRKLRAELIRIQSGQLREYAHWLHDC